MKQEPYYLHQHQHQASFSSMQQQQSQQLSLVTQQLQALSQHIQTNPYQPFQQLKQYITLYVQHHNRSQELFNLMCEHNMLAKLFTRVSKPIFVLQTFNLLLANTHQLSQLVYIFSHPLFHNYLLIGFENIVPLGAGISSNPNNEMSKINAHQCIEYYVQLLKTLVMKLQAQINQCTLLKLFCNSKYSYFPLLTNCILLAIKRNIKQELVRVTAQHCILQLIGIMARKKVGQCYFSSIHMVIFYYQIVTEMIEEQTTKSSNQDTTIKYILDLLKALTFSQSIQLKEKGFLLFFNILSNSLTFKFFKNPAPALHLLLKLSKCFSEIDELKYLNGKYISSIYFIMGKLLFNKYLNNVALSSIILVSESILELSQMKDINLLKIIKTYYEKNPLTVTDIQVNRNSFKQQQKHRHASIFGSNTSKYKSSILSIQENIIFDKYSNVLREIDSYNLNNSQFFQLKQNYYKKSSSSSGWISGIGSLFRKINVFDIMSAQYIKKLMQIASIRYTPQQQFSYLQQVFAPTSVYLYEFFKLKNKQKYIFGQRTQDTEKIEISFNQNRDEFLAQIQFFKIVLNIAQVAFDEIDMLESSRRDMIQILQNQYNPTLTNSGQVYFTLHFRQYFQHSMFQFICTSQSIKHRTQITSNLLNYLYKICSQLQLSITQNNRNKITSEIVKIQNQLFNAIKIKGFQDFFQYMDSQKQKKMIVQHQNSMLTSKFRFDSQQQRSNNRNSLSSSKKKRSIFGTFRSSSNNSSPIKDIDRFSIKQSSQVNQVQCKMLHLQLLRYILSQSPSINLFTNFSQQQAKPLHTIYETNFMLQYKGYEHSLYQLNGISFNSEVDCECVLKIQPKTQELTVVVQLYHNEKLILKCNVLDFTLSELKYDDGFNDPVGVDEQQNKKITSYVTILPTSNTLGFSEKEKAEQLLNTLDAIKQQYRKVKQNSILKYLNKDKQQIQI